MNTQRTVNAGALVELAQRFEPIVAGTIDPVHHVKRWLAQFPRTLQPIVASSLPQALSRTFIDDRKRQATVSAVARVLDSTTRRGLGAATLVHSRDVGHSGDVMAAALAPHLPGASQGTAAPSLGVYIDDALLSGSRTIDDLRSWVESSRVATVSLFYCVAYETGVARADYEIKAAAAARGTDITLTWWAGQVVRDWPGAETCDVLRLTEARLESASSLCVPSEWHRPACSTSDIIPSDHRDDLEVGLFAAGTRAMASASSLGEYVKPMGFQGLGTTGFGAVTVSDRNCPSHVPMAIWAGNAFDVARSPYPGWYPLFQRDLEQQRHEARSMQLENFEYPELHNLCPMRINQL